jgi:ubiquinone/menaquinone biosynthesis C-methylase UbiE
MTDNTQRFSNRVDNYVKYRPSYPTEIFTFLENEIQFNSSCIIADIGSGTGILSQMFLNNGNTVYAVEPNEPMRNAAEKILNDYNSFISVDATAEQTTLQDNSIDLITAAQAFHWFDPVKTRAEFKRILKENGYCCLIWNDRVVESPFEKAYEKLLSEYSTDYTKVDHKYMNDERVAAFFAPERYIKQSFHNKQVFDFEALKGRLLSSSYVPEENEMNYDAMIALLKNIFTTFNQNNAVVFNYETKVYLGKL